MSLQLVNTATDETLNNIHQLRVVETPFEPQCFQVQGISISAMSFDDAVAMLCNAPSQARKLRVHFAAVHTLVEASRSGAMHDCLASAEVIAPDGVPLVWYGRLKGMRPQRVCGPDTMLAVLDRARLDGSRHFFYGGAPGVAEQLAREMQRRYVGLQIAGVYCPPYRRLSDAETGSIVEMIDASGADYVWVGLGSPKQDLWMQHMQPRLRASVLLGVGAAFDFHSGLRRRAPRWMQRTGLEWTHRLISEPRRLAGRYLTQAAWLARLLITDGLKRDHTGARPEANRPHEAA